MSKPLETAGKAWAKSKETERARAADLYIAIKEFCDNGGTEVKAAELAGVDRMTVRRALGKL
jgi:hypothetical protein